MNSRSFEEWYLVTNEAITLVFRSIIRNLYGDLEGSDKLAHEAELANIEGYFTVSEAVSRETKERLLELVV